MHPLNKVRCIIAQLQVSLHYKVVLDCRYDSPSHRIRTTTQACGCLIRWLRLEKVKIELTNDN